jgi:hypothetical protein
LARRADNRNIAYKVPGSGLDLWPIFGTALLVIFIVGFALIVWQGRQTSHPSSHKTPTDRIALIAASPRPTDSATPTAEPTPTTSLSPSAQLVDTGATQANAPAAATAKPTARTTAAPKPTATHQPPTAILNVTPKAGSRAQPVTANAQFSWDATGIVSYQFNWGDGILDPPQTNPIATHLYPVAGPYLITVTVVDRVGLASSASTTVTLY